MFEFIFNELPEGGDSRTELKHRSVITDQLKSISECQSWNIAINFQCQGVGGLTANGRVIINFAP